jgi:hypothetical protein
MQCPKCGFEQPRAEECAACGIIIHKYRPHPVQPAALPQGPASESGARNARRPPISLTSGIILLLVVGFAAFAGIRWFGSRPVTHGPGVVAPDPPEQTSTDAAAFGFNGYLVEPLAGFHANARVLCKKKYWFGKGTDIAPVDLALGWGRMSDEAVLDKLNIHQSNRFYFWRTKAFPIPRKEIETHSANMHLIPADAAVRKRIQSVRVGEVIDFSGYLVSVSSTDKWHWKSSLTRTDTGNHACEVVFVKDFQTAKPALP